MNKDEILKDYKNKLKQLEKHNKAYFDNDNPLISDEKYDRLKSELLDLEKNYEFLKLLPLYRLSRNRRRCRNHDQR